MTEFFKPEPTKAKGFSKLEIPDSWVKRVADASGELMAFDGWKNYTIGKDVFKTKEEAIEAAKPLRAKRILALEGQIKKLKSFG